MIVLILSKCPQGLKGDITKWLLEINTGVYVGELSARVRDLLWKRVCKYCGSGEATMVFSARNEQGFSFYVHNTVWKPVDYDGIILDKKPLPPKLKNPRDKNLYTNEKKSKNKVSSVFRKTKNVQEKPIDITVLITTNEMPAPFDFVAIDLETTGLKSGEDSIIELAAVRYLQGKPFERFHALVKCEKHVSEDITLLTGITNELLENKGMPIDKAIEGMREFIKDDILVGHFISFDMLFIRKTCARLNMPLKQYRVIDTVALAKNFYKEPIENFRLVTLVKELGIAECQEHRALPDALLAAEVYLKLINF